MYPAVCVTCNKDTRVLFNPFSPIGRVQCNEPTNLRVHCVEVASCHSELVSESPFIKTDVGETFVISRLQVSIISVIPAKAGIQERFLKPVLSPYDYPGRARVTQ